MNRKTLSSLAALALLGATAAARAQEVAPVVPAAPAPPAVAAPRTPAAPAPDAPPAVAAVPEAPEAPDMPDMPVPAEAPEAPEALQSPPAPPQEPAAPAVATTLFISGNFLGVRTEEVTRENLQRYGLSGEPRGVGVREVVKGSPAEKAGLRANDVIVRFDGEQVTSVRKLTRLIEESAPDHTARITVLRGGSEQELSAKLTRREPFVAAARDGFFNLSDGFHGEAMKLGDEAWRRNSEQWKDAQEKWQKKWDEMALKHPRLFATPRRIGVATSVLGKQLADYFGVTHGVLINSVEAGSPAEKAGLKAGDIVTEADGQKVEDSDDLSRAIGAKQEGEVTLTVVRDRNRRTVRVTPERRATPQGMFAPGTFRLLESPVAAAFAIPRIQMHPDVLAFPRPFITPRVFSAPRIRVTPRARVFGRGGRVL